jgi:hypothetical protein
MHAELETAHVPQMIDSMLQGMVIPFLGAGVNMCGREVGLDWKRGGYLPNGKELREHLAGKFHYPGEQGDDLSWVSQYIDVELGEGPLYAELRNLFNKNYPITPLHRFFSTLPARLRDKGYPEQDRIYVTTNYDDVLERAFREANEPFDLVFFAAKAKEPNRGKFYHQTPDGKTEPIDTPNKCRSLFFEEDRKRTTILKIHGAVDRPTGKLDSYVITEDHYIDYLTKTKITAAIPFTLTEQFKKKHFLFLGYGLKDWNLRVILHQISEDQPLTFNSWAIEMQEPSAFERSCWTRRNVKIITARLEDYIAALEIRLAELPPWDGGQG